MHLFQVSFDRCLFSRMVCPPSIPSVSVYLFTRKKKHKNQQVLFKSGESAKVLCQCTLELLPFGNVLLNPALNIWRCCLIIWAIMETFQGVPFHCVAFLSYLSWMALTNKDHEVYGTM